MVREKSGANPNFLFISFNRRSRRSTLINLIGSLLDRNERVSSIVRGRFRHLIGNGMYSNFWTDNWTGQGELKQFFPRIFALATDSHGFGITPVSLALTHAFPVSIFLVVTRI